MHNLCTFNFEYFYICIMNTITSYLTFPLLQKTDKRNRTKDLFIIPFYILFISGPLIIKHVWPSFSGSFFFFYVVICLGIYALISIIHNRFIAPFRGKVYFASDGIAVQTDEQELFFPYDEVQKVSVYYKGSAPRVNFFPFQVISKRSLMNHLEIIHQNNIYHYYFHSGASEDENKLYVVMRSIIPQEVDCLYMVKNDVEVKRQNGALIREKKSVLRSAWSSFKESMDIVSYIQFGIFVVFLIVFCYYFYTQDDLLLGIVLSILSFFGLFVLYYARD